MDNFSFQSHKFKVYLNWIEIPYINVTVTFAVNNHAVGSVSVEPDPILDSIMEWCPIQIMVQDPTEPFNYLFFVEGFITSVASSDDGQSTSYVLSFDGALSNVGNGSPIMGVLGDPAYGSAQIYGGSLPNDTETGVSQLMLQTLFYSAIKDAVDAERANLLRDNTGYKNSIVQAVITFISNLSSYNLGLLLGTYGSNFYVTTGGITTALMDKLSTLAILDQMMTNNTTVSSDYTLLDIVRMLLNVLRTTLTQIPCPARPKKSRPLFIPQVPVGSEVDVVLPSFYSNLILPDMSYALPPACNWFFPSSIAAYSWEENYKARPTRKLAMASYNLSGLLVMAPSVSTMSDKYGLDVTATGDGKILNALSVFMGKPASSNGASLSYSSTFSKLLSDNTVKMSLDNADIKRSLNNTLLPIEYIKGVRPSMGLGEYSELLAFIAGGNMDDYVATSENATKTAAYKEKTKSVLDFLESMADYVLTLESRYLSVNLQVQSNIYVVPGLPAVVLMPNKPVYGVVSVAAYYYDASTGDASLRIDLDNCVSLRDLVGKQVSLSNVHPSLYVPDWGDTELTQAESADHIYNDMIGSSYTKAFTYLGIKNPPKDILSLSTVLQASTTYKTSFADVIMKINKRDRCISEEEYIKAAGMEINTAYNVYYGLWSPLITFSNESVREVYVDGIFKKFPNGASLADATRTSTNAILQYASTHAGGKVINHRSNDPFNSIGK